MIDPQTVQAVAEHGTGSGILTPAILGLIVTNLGFLAREWLKARATKRNGGGEAKAGAGQVSVSVGGSVGAGIGDGNRGVNGGQNKPMTQVERQMLTNHNRELGEHETNIRNVCASLEKYHQENRADHKSIFDKLEDLRVAVNRNEKA